MKFLSTLAFLSLFLAFTNPVVAEGLSDRASAAVRDAYNRLFNRDPRHNWDKNVYGNSVIARAAWELHNEVLASLYRHGFHDGSSYVRCEAVPTPVDTTPIAEWRCKDCRGSVDYRPSWCDPMTTSYIARGGGTATGTATAAAAAFPGGDTFMTSHQSARRTP